VLCLIFGIRRGIFRRFSKIYLGKDGVTEVEGHGWADARPWWASALDPFDIAGLIRGSDKKTAFWEVDEREGNRRGPQMGMETDG